MFGLGLPELIIIFLVILLLFGVKSLPEIARGLAKGIRTFKNEAREIGNDFDRSSSIASSTDSKAQEKDTSNDFDPSAKRPDWRPKQDEGSGSN